MTQTEQHLVNLLERVEDVFRAMERKEAEENMWLLHFAAEKVRTYVTECKGFLEREEG